MEFSRFWQNCVRVLKITKKPDKREFVELVKITGVGLLAIGLIGFLISLLSVLLTS